MKKWGFLLTCAFVAFLMTPTTEAGCWRCHPETGCCSEQVTGHSGLTVCSAVQVCIGGCACTNCQRGGSTCAGTAPPDCSNPHGICEEHQSLRQVPDIVPNGESIDLLWLIEPPSAPLAEPSMQSVACAAGA